MSVQQSDRRAYPSSHAPPVPASADAAKDAGLDALVTSHGPACCSLALRILRDADLAQDAVQDAFLEHWRRASFDASRSSPRAWLLMLTHRRAVDRVRHEQRRACLPLDGAPEQAWTGRGPEDLALASLLTPKVHAALATLPSVQQKAIALPYWGGYTQREIAEITHTPLGTVKTRMHNRMIALRQSLGEERNS